MFNLKQLRPLYISQILDRNSNSKNNKDILPPVSSSSQRGCLPAGASLSICSQQQTTLACIHRVVVYTRVSAKYPSNDSHYIPHIRRQREHSVAHSTFYHRCLRYMYPKRDIVNNLVWPGSDIRQCSEPHVGILAQLLECIMFLGKGGPTGTEKRKQQVVRRLGRRQ